MTFVTGWTGLIWPAFFAAAFVLRIWNIDRVPIWLDEAALVEKASQPFTTLLHEVTQAQPTPPLFFLFMNGWLALAPVGDLWVRLPSALFGSGFVLATAWLAGEIGGRRAALIAGLLSLINPLAIWYSQEARTYALSMFLAAVVLALEVRFLRRGTPALLPALALAMVLVEASHYSAVLVLGVATAIAVFWPSERRRRGWTLAALWVGGLPLLATREAQDYFRNLVTVGFPPDMRGFHQVGSFDELRHELSKIAESWIRFVGGPAIVLAPLLGGVMAVLAGMGSIASLAFGGRTQRILLFGVLASCVVAFAFPQTRILLSERYFSLVLGVLLAGLAAMLARLESRRLGGVLAFILALCLAADSIYLFDPRVGKGPDYRSPAVYLAQAAQPGDVLVEADPDYTFRYYVVRNLNVPIKAIFPPGGGGGESVEETAQVLREGVIGAGSIWYLPRWTEFYWDPQHRARTWLDRNLCLEAVVPFNDVELRHYRPCGRADRP